MGTGSGPPTKNVGWVGIQKFSFTFKIAPRSLFEKDTYMNSKRFPWDQFRGRIILLRGETKREEEEKEREKREERERERGVGMDSVRTVGSRTKILRNVG